MLLYRHVMCGQCGQFCKGVNPNAGVRSPERPQVVGCLFRHQRPPPTHSPAIHGQRRPPLIPHVQEGGIGHCKDHWFPRGSVFPSYSTALYNCEQRIYVVWYGVYYRFVWDNITCAIVLWPHMCMCCNEYCRNATLNPSFPAIIVVAHPTWRTAK